MKILTGMLVSLIAGTTIGGIAALMLAPPVQRERVGKELKTRWLDIKADLDGVCAKVLEGYQYLKSEIDQKPETAG